jgi:hypothetical protein
MKIYIIYSKLHYQNLLHKYLTFCEQLFYWINSDKVVDKAKASISRPL